MAAGSEGLWQYDMDRRYGYQGFQSKPEERLSQLSVLNCSACEWSFYSVFSSSYENGGYLAAFSFEVPDEGEETTSNVDEYVGLVGKRSSYERVRVFEEVIGVDRIFDSTGYSWGCRDKICQAVDGTVRVVKYQPWAEDVHERLRQLGEMSLSSKLGSVVSAGLATFGTIVECEEGLIVLRSDGEQMSIPGEPVNWRMFPRSKHYANHLHVIYDDRLEVFSFNHDYFIDQKKKLSGIIIK